MKNMKDKCKNFFQNIMKDKKKLAIFGGSIILVILIIIGIFFITGKVGAKSTEKQLKANLEELGREFYEDLYYPNTKNGDADARAKFLEGFKDQGLKFNIDNLSRYEYKEEATQEKLNTFKNDETGEECDKKASRIIIYPTEPYGLKDYRVEIELVCGFEEK